MDRKAYLFFGGLFGLVLGIAWVGHVAQADTAAAVREMARQQALDRKDRQTQRAAMLQVLQALDPEHAGKYDAILKRQRE